MNSSQMIGLTVSSGMVFLAVRQVAYLFGWPSYARRAATLTDCTQGECNFCKGVLMKKAATNFYK